MSSKRIAVVQLNSASSLEENFLKIEKNIKEASEKGAVLVALPENAIFMGKQDTDKLVHAEVFGVGKIQKFFSNLSKKYQVWIVGGTIPIQANLKQVFASCLVWDDNGIVRGRYDKIHLFDVRVPAEINDQSEVYQESNTIQAGQEVIVVDSPLGKLGLSICYDVRFPELYRQLNEKGAEILFVPAAFTEKTGKAHWETLLRARAIENLSYVVAPGQVGLHENGRRTYGNSLIIDPWGKILATAGLTEGVIVAEIDLNYLKKVRTEFHVLQHKKS